MNSCYLDSNALVYFANETDQKHKEAKAIIRQLNPGDWKIYISSLGLDEFLRGMQIVCRLTKMSQTATKEILEKSLNSILEIGNLEIVNAPTDKFANAKIINLMTEYGLRPRDAYHLLIMQENGVSHFATFDSDFRKVFQKGILKKI